MERPLDESTQINRRELIAAAAVTCACMLCPAVTGIAAPARGPVEIGRLADFAQQTVYSQWARSHGFFVVRRVDRLYACSSLCTHKNVKLLAAESGEFKCPRHGSLFSGEGKVEKGPAKRSLPRFSIEQNADGVIVVDTSRSFAPPQWDDPLCFVPIDQ